MGAVVAAAEIEHDVVGHNSSGQEYPTVELDVADPIEVDGNQVGRGAVDSQSLVSAVAKAGRIEYMDDLTVNDIRGTRTGIQYRAVANRDGCPRIAEKHLR